MFIDNIRFGFKDLVKNLKIFILFLIFLASISLITVSASISIIEIFKNKDFSIKYSLIPISYENEDFKKRTNNLEDFFIKSGKTKANSKYLNEKTNNNFTILIGDFLKNSNEKIIFVTSKVNLESLKQKNVNFIEKEKLDKKALKAFNIDQRNLKELVFIHPLSGFNSLKDLKFSLNEYKDIIENTKFTKDEIKKGVDLKFEKIISNDNLFLKRHENSMSKEINFITKYIFVYVFLLLLSFLICFYIFMKNIYKKLTTQYKIHMIQGVRYIDIFIRNSVFSIILVLFNFILISFLNEFKINTIFFIDLILNFIYFLALEIVLLNVVFRTKLNLIKENYD